MKTIETFDGPYSSPYPAPPEARWLMTAHSRHNRCKPLARNDATATAALLRRFFEKFQIRRRLILARGHQVAVIAHEVALLPDIDMMVILDAEVLGPQHFGGATVAPGHRPWTGQGMVERRDVVVQHVPVGLVEVNPLLDDGLIILVQRDSVGIECARTLQGAGLDHE